MSYIFGILSTDSGSVSGHTLAAMGSAFAGVPADGKATWKDGPMGLGACCHPNATQSQQERQPLELGSRHFVGDVRLDNREALIGALDVGYSAQEPKDGELIILGYAKWGESLPLHLLGDFAFAIWDAQTDELFLACDYMACRSLYYRRVGEHFLFANCIRPLVSPPFSRPELDLESVARMLRDGEHYDEQQTLLMGVRQLPAGSSLTLQDRGQAINRYWSIDVEPEPFKGTVEEAAATLRELLQEAVHTRLQTNYPVAAHLSGGLDSSAIIALAAPKLPGRLHAYSWMHQPEAGQEHSDPEWATGRLLADVCNVPLEYSEPTPEALLEFLCQHDIALGDTTDIWVERLLRGKAVTTGARTLLSGWGGDQFITHYGNNVYAQRLLQGEALSVLRELGDGGPRRLAVNARDFLLKPLLARYRRKHLPGCLDFATAEMQQLAASSDALDPYSGVFLQREMRCPARFAHLRNRLRSWYAAGLDSGVSYSYPLLDKRVIEFALSVPAEFYRWQGEGRHLMRSAMADLPPQDLWHLNQKAEPSRVKRAGEVELSALKLWLQSRGKQLTRSHLVDVALLHTAIESATIKNSFGSLESSLRFMALRRSILVLELENRYHAEY